MKKAERLTGKDRERFATVLKEVLEDTEESLPLRQKHLAKELGVSTRVIRYWKTGKRFPTRDHAFYILHYAKKQETYIQNTMKGRNLGREEAISLLRRKYKERMLVVEEEQDWWEAIYPEKTRGSS